MPETGGRPPPEVIPGNLMVTSDGRVNPVAEKPNSDGGNSFGGYEGRECSPMMGAVTKSRSTGRRLRWFLLISIILGLSAIGTFVFYLATTRKSGTFGNVLGLYGTIGQLIIAVLAYVADRAAARRTGGERDEPTLSRLLRAECEAELERRGLKLPLPLDIRWGRAANIAQDDDRRVWARSIGADDPLWPAAGLVKSFRRRAEGQHPRMLILGPPGGGKSTLALLFTRAALVDAPAVLLAAATWQPKTETLRDFALRRIPEAYPKLAAQMHGEAIEQLFDDGRILVVLDGLDEMPAARLRPAIKRLNEFGRVDRHPLVVTCRTGDYDTVRTVQPLEDATVLVLERTAPKDVISYLQGRDPAESSPWKDVIAEIRREPDGPLATALGTPMMTTLARTVYANTGARPSELTGSADEKQVESRVVDNLATALSADPDRRRQSRLSWLAYYLAPDLAWWELVRAVPPAVIVSAVTAGWAALGALAGALTGVAAGVVAGAGAATPEAGQSAAGLGGGSAGAWLARAVLPGIVAGTAIGLVSGLSAARGIARSPARRSRLRTAFAVTAAAARDSLAAMAVVGGYLLVAAGRAATRTSVPDAFLGIVLTGLAGLLVGLIGNGLSAGRGLAPSRTRLQPAALGGWLANGLVTAFVLALPFSVLVGVIAGIEYGAANGVSTALTMLAAACVGLGSTIGVGRWLAAPVPGQELPTPRAMLAGDRSALLVAALIAGGTAGVAAGVLVNATNALKLDVLGYTPPWLGGLVCGVVVAGVVLCGSGSPWFSFVLARAWFLAVRHRLPWDLIRFLETATVDQILRAHGSVYQFRHVSLRDYLAKAYAQHSRWLVGRPVGDAAPEGSVRWSAVGRGVLGALAFVVVLGGPVVAVVPQLGLGDQIRDTRAGDEQARALIRAADDERMRNPVDSLRLRIAAASLDPDGGSRDDLTAFLRMRLAPPPYAIIRANRVVSAGPWTVTLDAGGMATAWDRRRRAPARVPIDGQSIDVAALGDTGWVELFATDGHARLADLNTGGSPPVDLGPAPDSVDPIGTTGWVVAGYAGRVTAWNLRTTPPTAVPLAQDATDVRVVGATGWVVVLDRGTVKAWNPQDGPVVLQSRAGSVRVHPYDIVEIDAADGRTLSQWDLPPAPLRPASVGDRLGEIPPAVYSSADGRWLVADRGADGTAVADVTVPGSAGTPLTPDRVVAPGPGDWVITAGDDGHATTAWNLASSPPTRVPLGPAPVTTQPAPPPWLVLHSTTADAWNLSATPPEHVPLGPDVQDTEPAGGHWLLVHPPNGAAPVAWLLGGTPTRRVTVVAGARHAQLSDDGRWAVVTFTGQSVEGLTAVVDLARSNVALPAAAVTDPIGYACGLTQGGLSQPAWTQYAPTVAYRRTC